MRQHLLKPTQRLLLAMSLTVVGASLGACASSADQAPTHSNTETAAPQVFELRTYTTHPGKLSDLHSRFSNHTMRLFEKHGIKNIAYWTPTDTPNTLVYIVAHQSKASAADAWKAFIADPQWRVAYAESQANGPLVANIESVFLTSTNYSPRIATDAKF